MPRPASLFLLPLCSLLLACGDKSDEEATGGTGDDTGSTSDDGGGEGGGDGSDAPCPPEVPEEYQYVWDCKANTCDGGSVMYHRGYGTSEADGSVTFTEDWYMFNPDGTYCMDSFAIAGDAVDIDPATFNCTSCEEIYEVRWEMSSGNTCGLVWGALFVDDEETVEGPFDGYLMFDTHSAFGDRNEDNKMLVFSAMVSGRYYFPNSDYGRGTANPSSSTDGPPQDYEWTSAAMCLQSGG